MPPPLRQIPGGGIFVLLLGHRASDQLWWEEKSGFRRSRARLRANECHETLLFMKAEKHPRSLRRYQFRLRTWSTEIAATTVGHLPDSQREATARDGPASLNCLAARGPQAVRPR